MVATVTIGPGITVLNFLENPINVPTLFPYFQLSFSLTVLNFGLKLELPVTDGKVVPNVGCNIGLGWAWGPKHKF
jgi:hypothetical protein